MLKIKYLNVSTTQLQRKKGRKQMLEAAKGG
jgi:hypothetical protein